MAVDNANPVVFEVAKQRSVTAEEEKDDVYDEIDAREVFGEFWCSIPVHVPSHVHVPVVIVYAVV